MTSPALPEPGEDDDGGSDPVEGADGGNDPQTGDAQQTRDEQTSPERDWDAEWRGLTAPLAAEPAVHLISDAPLLGAGHGPRDYSPPEVEERWEPEEPPALPTNRSTRLAWAAIVGGPVLMLLAVIAFDTAPVWYVGLCIALFVGGCLWGFLRLPGTRRDDGDDGAAV